MLFTPQHCGRLISVWRKPVDFPPQTEPERDFMARIRGQPNPCFQLRRGLLAVAYRKPRWVGCAGVCGPSPGASSQPRTGSRRRMPSTASSPPCRCRADPRPCRGSLFSPAPLLPQPPPGEELLAALPLPGLLLGPAAGCPPGCCPPFCMLQGRGADPHELLGRGCLTLYFRHRALPPAVRTMEALLSDVSQACGTV